MRPILQAVAGLLERAEVHGDSATARGYVGDQLISFALKMRGQGSASVLWTEITVPAPEGIIVGIRKPTASEERDVKKGLAVAFRTGDPEFDEAFIVDGAPERLVREIASDEEIRRGVFSLRSPNTFVIKYQVLTTRGAFTLQMPGWLEDADRAALAVRTMAKLGGIAAQAAGRARADAESGYRDQIGPERRRRDQQELEEATRHISVREATRKRRESLGKIFVGALILLVLAGAVAFALGPQIAAALG